ncbi:MAG: glycoside hydrolase family 88 protein [Clostridia bacterium]|nr:glycoside hydrolase family 88 protein [Clostridia bacterium]
MFDQTLMQRVKLATLAMQRYNWEQGTVAQAFLESGDLETAILMAHEAAYRQDSQGRCGQIGSSTACTDPCSIGETLIIAVEKTGDNMMKNALDRLIRWAVQDAPRNADGIVYHLDDAPEFWVDSFYMLPPFLARAGYIDEAVTQIDGYWKALFHEKYGLLSHIWDDRASRFVREDFWGVGNGWAMAGLIRVISLLPDEREDEREKLVGRLKRLLDSALLYQRSDGLFHDVLNRPDTFVETNFAQMMAYTIFRGVASGVLSRCYLAPARRMRAAALAKVDHYGLVRDVCGAPTFDRPGIAPEGQAFCLLMQSAWRDGDFEEV